MKIFKYPLPAGSENSVQWVVIPSSAKFISAIEQNGLIVLYAAVSEPVSDKETRRVLVLGTGQNFNADRENEVKPFKDINFISTVKAGPFVWHVAELIE